MPAFRAALAAALRITTFLLCLAVLLATTTASASASDDPAKPSLEVDWYGYIKLDASWDESLIESGNFARWVESPSVVEEHSHFNMTARQSRLGLDLHHATTKGPSVDANVEIDFYGGGAENKNRPQLRHAFFDLEWPEGRWVLRAGQTNDLISPLAPTTVNYSVAWWVGNIGYRRPQFTIIRNLGSGQPGAQTRLAIGISRTIGDDFGAVEPGDSGVDSGAPTVQFAASRSLSVGGDRTLSFGTSGHWGREHLEEQRGLPDPEFDSWSVNLDLKVPVAARGTFKLEAWTGENLDDYFGGIAQGIDVARELGIAATGGWLAYEHRLRPSLFLSFGIGIDDPVDEDLPAGARIRNLSVWQNLWWDLNEVVRFGIEGSWWETEYSTLEDGDSFRFQTSVVYSFAR